MPPTARRHDVLTVPNVVTVVRLLALPVFVWLLFARDNRAAAAFLLGGLGATDWVDGYLARRLGQVTELGKVLDPVADRILLGTAVIALMVDDAVPRWIGVLVLVREAAVSATALLLGALGARRIDVTSIGKTGALLQMIALPLFCAGSSTLSWAPVAQVLAWTFIVPGLGISYYAAAGYVPLARGALADGRTARAGGAT